MRLNPVFPSRTLIYCTILLGISKCVATCSRLDSCVLLSHQPTPEQSEYYFDILITSSW